MKALIIDDDRDLLDVMTYAFRREGYEITCATDGLQGLDRLRADEPDIVVLDIRLPRLNGFEVCRRIRHISEVPIIMVTARGEEHDVLSRYLGAAREARADLVVRVTADCPLIDPGEVDRVILALESDAPGADYAANVVERTFPRGLDAEALFQDVLERIGRLARSAAAREHVTRLVYDRRDLFLVRSVTDSQDNSDLRWTVDTPADLAMMRRLYEGLAHEREPLDYHDILAYVRRHPEISAMNAHVQQLAPHA
jgi:spore coat polysaccharide biosynthesis protein SpsF